MSKVTEGAMVSGGRLVAIKPFGAFRSNWRQGETGFIHISQISTKYVEKVEDELSVGDVVKAKVLSVEPPEKFRFRSKH